jgi:iron complex transport system substrate-binding protein
MSAYPARIVCLTEETAETLYLLGEGDRVVGISGYTLRPPEARLKPKVSSFISARYERIEALEPDLVLGFSDLQAGIAADLAQRGLPVLVFNQRSVAEILQMIRSLAGLIGCQSKGESLATGLEAELERVRESARRFSRRPRVFFEEWDDPLISGIRWVEELVEIAGGEPVFPELRAKRLAKDRIVQPDEVAQRNPDAILASWCGKRVRKSTISSRPGWHDVSAVRNNHIYDIPSTYILQPGPAALTEGVRQIHASLELVANGAHSTVTLDGINRLS